MGDEGRAFVQRIGFVVERTGPDPGLLQPGDQRMVGCLEDDALTGAEEIPFGQR
jgi:hypothetical protein